MDDFVKSLGLPFFSHVLWRLSETFVRAYEDWQPEAGFKAPPRTHSTLQAIADGRGHSVVDVAVKTRQSHPLVIRWVRLLRDQGLVQSTPDPMDRRRTILSLTSAGEAEIQAQKVAREIIAETFGELLREADADVFDALWRIEEACRREPFLERLRRRTPDKRVLVRRGRREPRGK